MPIPFLNEVDIQLILEFKFSFAKYHSVCPDKFLKGVFLGHPDTCGCIVYNLYNIYNKQGIWRDKIAVKSRSITLFQKKNWVLWSSHLLALTVHIDKKGRVQG